MKMTSDVNESVRIALHHIERAQQELETACQALSPVRGATRHWEAIMHLFVEVQDRWHKLDEADAGKWEMDR
jgi:hypothetical protein